MHARPANLETEPEMPQKYPGPDSFSAVRAGVVHFS